MDFFVARQTVSEQREASSYVLRCRKTSWHLVVCQNPTHLDPAEPTACLRGPRGQCSPTATVATIVP